MKLDLRGRPDVIDQIRENFQSAVAASVEGSGGPGKPALTKLLAELYTEVYLDLEGVERPSVDLSELVQAYHRM